MADILGKDLDKWDDSLITRQPFNLKESEVSGAQFMTGSDFMRSAKISSDWKMPVAIPSQAKSDTKSFLQPLIRLGESAVDVVADYLPGLANLSAQYAIELTGEEKKPETIGEKLLKGTETGNLYHNVARLFGLSMIGADAIANRKEYEEKAKSYDEAVELINNRDYPLTKYARRVLADTTDDVESRRIIREMYNQSRGIDSSKWYNQAGSIIGAMVPTIVVSRGAASTARMFGANRLGAVNVAQNVAKGFVGGQMAGEYAEQTAAQYLEKTGDKTFANFKATDASGLMAMAYGAIGAQIEFIGGIEPVMAGALNKVGLRSGLLKAGAKIGAQEAGEEFLQGLTEILMRKIDNTTDKTWGEGLTDALNGAIWGLFIGGTMGTGAFYTNRRNLVKGIKTAIPNITDTQATQIADAMIDNVAESASQDPTLRANLRQKVAALYRDIDLDNKEDRIDAMTDLEYSLITMDSADRGIDLADHELFQGEVNELGWFRAGIPETEREQIKSINDNIVELRTQLAELNKAKEKDWEKIEEIENKLAQASQYVLEKVSDLATEFEKLERKYVAKQKKEWFDKNITKGNTFTTDEGTFTEYQLRGDKRNMATFTVFESPDGWIVRNAYVPENMQKKGVATNFYNEMNQRSIEATGKPLRSTQPRTLKSGETVFELSDAGKKLWDSLVKQGVAKKLKDKTYEFVSSAQPMFQPEQFDLADENARLDDIYPAYDGETIEVDGKERTVYNSEGQRIAKSKEALTNFWRWFGDSKVVDEQGRPLVVYHGTDVEFDSFNKSRTGIFFNTTKKLSKLYGTELYSVYLKIENPFIVPKKEFELNGIKLQPNAFDTINIQAEKMGYDGVINKDVYDSPLPQMGSFLGDNYTVFEPNQIKSVDNRGTYSSDTGNIYWQSEVYDGLTTTRIWNVMRILRGLKDSSTERLLYDKQKDTWFLENADDATHVQMFIKAFNQGNYPEFNNEREAEQYFQENYLADDQNLLQFLAQKYDKPEDAKQAMEHTLGTDEYTHAYLRDNLVVYSRYETDLSETDFPLETFDHYKVEYDENNNREIKLVEKAKESYVEPVKDKPIDPRDRIPKVRGGWTKEKILRYLKNYGSRAGAGIAAREIANFDTFEDFMNHVFYHGARYGTSGRMQPSITMSDREVGRIGGGGYGEKYWAISITKSKKVAGNFATSMGGGNIYPVLLAKNVKVIEMPELTDSADLDDHIVDLYEKGIDAVWIGDKNAGEQELAVINPRALINIGSSEYYGAYKLGSEENPIRLNTEEDFRKIYEFAKNYKNMDENTRLDEAKRIVRWQNRVSGAAPKTYRGAYIPQFRFILRANKMDASTLSHELAHDWMEANFARYRSGKQGKDFMKAWGALEKALGIPENATSVPTKASETFARAYEAWIVQNEDWAKLIAVEDKDKDAVEKLMKDYQGDLRDIYNDISNPYFKQTWGKLGELKPELKAWFDRVVNITDLDVMVERGEMTEEQASTEKLNRAIDTVIETTEDEETAQTLKEVRTLNDTQRYEVEGGSPNSIQRRLSNLAREIDENNMALKGDKYDTRRDMMAVAEAADNFVKTRLDDALAIINGEMSETEGLYKEDLYTALERLAVENGDLGLIDELKNSEVANRLAKELGQRVAGFRNFKQSTDIDVVSALKSLDMKFNKALDNKKAKQQYDAALKLLDESIKQQDKVADKELDNFLKDLECK